MDQIFSVCTSLPSTLENMEPITPTITYGSLVTVTCVTDYSLYNGDKEITCQGGDNFSWNAEPACKAGKFY